MLQYSNEVLQEDLKDILAVNLPYENLKNKSVLITGATGMLASYLVYFFNYLNQEKKYNIKIYALIRNRKKAEIMFSEILKNKNFVLLEQNIEEKIKLSEKINWILHLASSANPRTILEDPVSIIKANTIGTFNVFEIAKKNDAKVFFSSTREVYGEIKDTKYIKESEFGVINFLEDRACYPESKRVAETICKSYFLQYGVDYQIARIAHVYGPGMNIENDGRIMSDIISDIVNNRDICLRSEGLALRAFCYISDAIIGILTILLKGKMNEVYNLSNESEEISVRDLANLCINIFQERKIKIIFTKSDNKSLYTNYKRVGLDNFKLNSLGWKIKIGLKEGIEKTVKSFQEY